PELLPRLVAREALPHPPVTRSAWEASYHTHMSEPAPRSAGALGSDALAQIDDSKQAPFRYVCDLVIETIRGAFLGGTGWLIGPRTVITAGHNVFQREESFQDWARSIRVSIARNGAADTYPALTATGGFKSVEGWTVAGQEESDFGAIILP